LSSTSLEEATRTQATPADAAAAGASRLTVAQALVRFLQAQYSRRDGEEQRLVPAIFRDLRPPQRRRPQARQEDLR
jgi:hypothetical protein